MPPAPSHEPRVPTVHEGARRPYHAPELTELGAMAEVTNAGSGNVYNFDGASIYAS
jgi:hypothetical protein